jgi:phosphoribosylaminoimidazolecarboxamide formyltransferase/IMP cyclohydrolase
VRDVSDLTGFPEMMDGRVKTLHPMVHGGLLAVRDNPEHAAAMEAHAIGAIDLVVVNLYPFEATVAKGADRDEVIENIDIGGPSMVRSAAKNHAFVTIVTDPADYATLLGELEQSGGATTLAFRKAMAAKALPRPPPMTPRSRAGSPSPTRGSAFRHAQSSSKLVTTLRYGENPHQNAALYVPNRPATIGLPQAQQVQGKELSYNNYNDANAALELVAEFAADKPTVVIVKHANPCGVATADTLLEAWQQALACDSASAFGGIVAVNQPLDGPTAKRSARSSPKWSSPWRRRGREGRLRAQEEPAPAAGERPARRASRRPDAGADRRRPAGAGSRQRRAGRRRAEGGDQAPADRTGTEGLPVRLDRGEARQVERDRLCQEGVTAGIGAGQMNRRDPRASPPPRRRKPPKRTAGTSRARSAPRSRPTRSSPCRRLAGGGGSRRHGGDPAGRLDPRRGRDQGGRRSRPRHGSSPECATSATDPTQARCEGRGRLPFAI